jgi:hypothetical protein
MKLTKHALQTLIKQQLRSMLLKENIGQASRNEQISWLRTFAGQDPNSEELSTIYDLYENSTDPFIRNYIEQSFHHWTGWQDMQNYKQFLKGLKLIFELLNTHWPLSADWLDDLGLGGVVQNPLTLFQAELRVLDDPDDPDELAIWQKIEEALTSDPRWSEAVKILTGLRVEGHIARFKKITPAEVVKVSIPAPRKRIEGGVLLDFRVVSDDPTDIAPPGEIDGSGDIWEDGLWLGGFSLPGVKQSNLQTASKYYESLVQGTKT